jgi:arylsulfatase A
MRATVRLSFLLVTVSMWFGIAVAEVAGDERPNIIVLLCDDLGYGDLSCYGHPHIRTPNLDGLATGGIRYTDFYSAAPVCSPSRVGLLTGRSPNRAGVYDWIPPAGKPQADAREQVHMRRSEVTIPQLLKDAGYQTCLAGKWHCNSRFNQKAQPQPGDFGFDHWLATQNNAAPTHQNPTNFVRNGADVGPLEGFSCQIVVDEALRWLREKRNPNQPFFLFIPFHEPHEPVASPENLVEKYRDVATTLDEAEYFANVENVDHAVGKLLRTLDAWKLRENTLVVFTSDNGPETLNRYRNANRSYGRPGPLRGMKLHTHDAGFHVVGIVNWPGTITAGQVVRTPVSSLDFLPTFCQLAERKIPGDLKLDGTDFRPSWTGQPMTRTKPLVWAYFNALNEARVAMRDGRWKVLARLDGGNIRKFGNVTTENVAMLAKAPLTDWEIYDLEMDPSEKVNLAESRPDLREQLAARLDAEYRELVTTSHVWQPMLRNQ